MRVSKRASGLLLALAVAGSNVVPATAAETAGLPKTNTIAFVLPINEQIGGKLFGPAGGNPPFAVVSTDWSPTSESVLAGAAPDAVPPGETVAAVTSPEAGPIVIDNDLEQVVVLEEFNWEGPPDEEGKTKIQAGARFPVAIVSEHTSKNAKVGDPVEGRLKTDIKIGGKLIAKKGAKVVGHVTTAYKARRLLHAELAVTNHRWFRANGAIGFQFDEILNDSGEHIPLIAKPARKSRIVKNSAEGRVLGVNHNGEVATPLSIQLKHQALHLAIRGAASAGGVFSFGIVPLAYGTVGAINPSFAFMHPVGKNVPHRRIKGFAMGVVSGLPGGFLIADTIIRGQEAVIKPGDEFLAEFKQDFTGEAATDAELLSGAKTKVHGEVLPADGTPNKKK